MGVGFFPSYLSPRGLIISIARSRIPPYTMLFVHLNLLNHKNKQGTEKKNIYIHPTTNIYGIFISIFEFHKKKTLLKNG